MSRPLCVAGKRPGQPQVMAAVAGLKDCLVFILDKVTKRRFLVDTGAEVSVVPVTGVESKTVKSGPFLLAANGSKIHPLRPRNSPCTSIQVFTTGNLLWLR